MGRNNFLYFRSINGADVAMLFYTIIGSCKILGLNPKAYLLEMTLLAIKGEKLETPYQYGFRLQKKVEAEINAQIEAIPRGPLLKK